MKKVYFVITLLLFILLIPWLLWSFADKKSLEIAIIDKTVPDTDYREHLGVTWFLNNAKYVNADHKPFNETNDYYGVKPNLKDKEYQLNPLPTDYELYDIIYLADTYGVFEDDVPWNTRERKGEKSNKIYGGLSDEEWEAIVERIGSDKKSLIVAEFNSFASPTKEPVREQMTDYFGVEWSGWVGRYFSELDYDQNIEIPQWVITQHGDDWNYSGEGFLLVNDWTYEVIVLEMDEHLTSGINLSFTDKGEEHLGLKMEVPYNYWFDIVTPASSSDVYAKYDWELTEKGEQLLAENDIPVDFAAVVANTHGANTSYYFAGDYNDINKVPYFYQYKGIDVLYKHTQLFSDDYFYWAAYVPMMKAILAEFEKKEEYIRPITSDTPYTARINDGMYEVLINNEWQEMTLKGVNIGMAKPGAFPGEAAITEEEYYRWFTLIGEMNANTIRVYTLHPPGFYQALQRYNEEHENKIYVLHGIWIDEAPLESELDAFDEEITAVFQSEMKKVADAIHGNAIVEREPGHASGLYRANVSDYVIGWILGIEWYPFMVENMTSKHKGMPDYDGTYFKTKNAAPFEIWLAKQMDQLTTYEWEQYNQMRPMSFTNWPTTDILHHPSDSTNHEDIASIDPNVIYTKNEAKQVGQFASYHVYPYYPDFLNFDQTYQSFVDHRGEKNNYAGYLKELHEVHRLPILIAEFGVPASRGMTHENIHGWNQGFLSEAEQGEIVTRLYEDIIHEGMMGGLIFTWQDEWFKRTWNTMEYDNPQRRPYWSNAQTNEEQFGLLSFDRHKIRIDGDVDDWENKPLYETSDQILKSLAVDHDERYLYFHLHVNDLDKGYPVILLDTVPKQGNTFISSIPNVQFEQDIDFMIHLEPNEARLLVHDYYDLFSYQYGYKLEMIDLPTKPENNSGQFIPMSYALNKEYVNPETNEKYPFQSYETGLLKKGNGNPDDEAYNSLVDYSVNDNGDIEIRIPWLLLQAKDPSQREFTGNLYQDGMEASMFIDEINVGVLYVNEDGDIVDTMPHIVDGKVKEFKGYTWEAWNEPLFEERLKQSYYIIQEKFKE